jgi:hypothetical protein
LVTGFAMGLWGGLWIGIGGAKGVGICILFLSVLLVHFFQMITPIRKTARAILIMAAGEVNVQWALSV